LGIEVDFMDADVIQESIDRGTTDKIRDVGCFFGGTQVSVQERVQCSWSFKERFRNIGEQVGCFIRSIVVTEQNPPTTPRIDIKCVALVCTNATGSEDLNGILRSINV